MPQASAKSHAFSGHRRGMGLVQTVTSVGTVVVLTATILTPTLMGLRERNRRAVCTMRIGQLTRAMLVYAADYDETPPFMGRGDGTWPSGAGGGWPPGTIEEWPAGSGMTAGQWTSIEDWLMPNVSGWFGRSQTEWPNDARPRNGSLFPYTRSESLYLCPSFERTAIGVKTQNVFNYTRTSLGRRLYSSTDNLDPNSPYYSEGDFFPGEIVRISEVHRPDMFFMMYDESLEQYVVASPVISYSGSGLIDDRIIDGSWSPDPPDCVFRIMGSEVGQYHGRPMRTPAGRILSTLPSRRQGNVAYYDGHVELLLDPLPERIDPMGGACCGCLLS